MGRLGGGRVAVEEARGSQESFLDGASVRLVAHLQADGSKILQTPS
jgi:hypothetical protein